MESTAAVLMAALVLRWCASIWEKGLLEVEQEERWFTLIDKQDAFFSDCMLVLEIS